MSQSGKIVKQWPHFWQRFGKAICYSMRSGVLMRILKSYILRLYIDLDQPDQLCGDLQTLPDRKAYPFKNQSELLDLVHRFMGDEQQNISVDVLEAPDETKNVR
jgi:hypothetical protein